MSVEPRITATFTTNVHLDHADAVRIKWYPGNEDHGPWATLEFCYGGASVSVFVRDRASADAIAKVAEDWPEEEEVKQ